MRACAMWHSQSILRYGMMRYLSFDSMQAALSELHCLQSKRLEKGLRSQLKLGEW